jgi:hypothetical protein
VSIGSLGSIYAITKASVPPQAEIPEDKYRGMEKNEDMAMEMRRGIALSRVEGAVRLLWDECLMARGDAVRGLDRPSTFAPDPVPEPGPDEPPPPEPLPDPDPDEPNT